MNGTGPYRLARWDKGQQIVLDQFADYWKGWSGSHVAQVIQRVVPSAGTQQLLLEKGDAHLVVLPSIGITQDPKEIASKPGVKLVETPSFRVTVISLNTQKGPLKDVRLRKALQHAFARFAPAAVVEDIIAQGVSTRSATKEVTVLFADLKGFTPLAERLDPARLTTLLNG